MRRVLLAVGALLSLLLAGGYAFVLVMSGYFAFSKPTSEFSGIAAMGFSAMVAALGAPLGAIAATYHALEYDDLGLADFLRALLVAALVFGAGVGLATALREGRWVPAGALASAGALAFGVQRARRGLRARHGS